MNNTQQAQTNSQSGVRHMTNELQRFNIKIQNNTVYYNGYSDPAQYAVHLQNLYLAFNKELYSALEEMATRDEQIDYLKTLQMQLSEIDEVLLQNRDLLAYFESMLAIKGLTDFSDVIANLEGMNVNIDAKSEEKTEPDNIDTISFIDKQINFSYKAISLVYNMITLESEIPSSYGMEHDRPSYRFKWKGSKEELAELFIELQRKNWIETLQPRDVDLAAKSIQELFDVSRTSVKEEPTETDPLTSILKGQVETYSGKQTYPDIDKKGYEEKFAGILENSRTAH